MNVGGCEKNVNARPRRTLQGLPCTIHVARTGASQCRDDGPPQRSGDPLDSLKVAIGSNRKSRLDHIHAKPVELLSQAQFFLHIHAATRRLFSVTKSGVKDSDAWSIHRFFILRMI